MTAQAPEGIKKVKGMGVPPSRKGTVARFIGTEFSLPPKGFGKYCDKLRDRGLGWNSAANGFCALCLLF